MEPKLSTFQLVNNGKVISPILVTTREWGKWFELVYDEYTINEHLYVKARRGEKSLLERHPGTRIGRFFDSDMFTQNDLGSVYILWESNIVDKLISIRMLRGNDNCSISINGEKKNLVRLLTAGQIEVYIQSNIDRNFNISAYIGTSKSVVVKDSDLEKIVKFQKMKSRVGLF